MRVLARSGHAWLAIAVGALIVFFVATTTIAQARASSASSSLGPPHPASGSTVTIGMIIDGHAGGTGLGANVEQGARIAVRYQNEYGDGADGHKIDLLVCENDKTAAGGQRCATQMVQDQVAAVLEPFSGQGPTEVPTLTQAGIPYIAMTGGSAAELTTRGAFALLGGVPAILGAVAMQAKKMGYSKMTLIVENTPTIVQGTEVLGSMVFKAVGVGFDLLTADPEATDLEAQLQMAVAGGASAVGVGGDTGFCSAFLKSYAELHLHMPKYVLATCVQPSIVDSSALDRVLKGSFLAGAEPPSSQDDRRYAAIMEKYAPTVDPDRNVSVADFAGMVPVLAFAELMKGASPLQPVTAASVLARTESATNVVIPLLGGATFTCNGAAIPPFKSVCSSATDIGVLGRGYRVTHIRSYDPAPLY